MNLKVLFVNEKDKIQKQKLSINLSNLKGMQCYEYINGMHCFKLTNEHSIDEKGIEIDEHEFVNGPKFFEVNNAKSLVSLGFIFVNSSNGNVYVSNVSNTRLKKLMNSVFGLNDVDTRVDIDKLKSITKIEIKLKNDPQMSLFYDTLTPSEINLVNELGIQDQEVETITSKLEFKKTGINFLRKNLSKVMKKYKHLRIEGLDENNNIIKIRDSVQLEIKIDISYKSFEELNSILLSTIVDKIIEKEKGALNDY